MFLQKVSLKIFKNYNLLNINTASIHKIKLHPMERDKIQEKINKILPRVVIPILVLGILLCFKNFVLLKIDHKETVGIVLYKYFSDGEGSNYEAKYKYKVENKVYYSYDKHPPENIKKGVKINIYYFPLLPSICRAQFDEIIEGDTTIFLDYDFHKEN